MGEHSAYALRRIVGAGWAEPLLVARAELPEPALTVAEIRRTVLVDRVVVIRGQVLITGRLRSLYTYAAGEAPSHGAVKALSQEQGFDVALPVAGAEQGMEGRLLAAHVVDAAVEIAALTPQGHIVALEDRSLLHLAVQLLSEESVTLETDSGLGAARLKAALAAAADPAGASQLTGSPASTAAPSSEQAAPPTDPVAGAPPPNRGTCLSRFAFRRIPTG